MQTDHHLAAHGGSPIRPLTLGADGVRQPSHDAAPGSFIDLAPLTEEQKAAMAKALFKHKVGDAESCMLFVRAMEYELHTYREAAAEEAEAAALHQPAPPQPAAAFAADSPELAVIAHAARELAALLEALPYEAQHGLLDNLETQDPMQRGYDQRYLQQMQIESLRLAAACGETAQAAAPAAAETHEAARHQAAESAASQHFAASLVHMFEECFERAPTADPEGDFAKALGVISEGTGVPMRLDRAALELTLMPHMG